MKSTTADIKIEEFDYPLPDGRIARHPMEVRDACKLLVRTADGSLSEHVFSELPELLPADAMLVYNNTRVINARLRFRKDAPQLPGQQGALIEIFCLEPVLPEEYVTMFAVTDRCRWKCIVGNVKRWKNDTLHLYNPENDEAIIEMGLQADLIERCGETSIVEFSWTNGAPFSRVLEICGSIPIPPYLNRGTETIDLERYQTLYARFRGSVAAPTAGLHFTEPVLESIRSKNVSTETVCLHVGAGTFLPVKSSLVSEHTMHREPFVVTLDLLEKLISRAGSLVAVGTTSVRTLESLYYVGVKCLEGGKPGDVGQWEPYEREYPYTVKESLEAIVSYLKANCLNELKVGTRIIIVPGYRFKIVDVLVTNFHQPQSTLLLLISAFVGGDWHKIYDFALERGFRFLSYGDSSILFRAQA